MTRGSERKDREYDPGEVRKIIQDRLNGGMKSPNLFLVPKGGMGSAVGTMLCERLRREFTVQSFDIVLPPREGIAGSTEYFCIAIDSSQPERVRDAIKERLWPVPQEGLARTALEDILRGRYEKPVCDFRLEEHGVFVPCRTRKHTPIRIHSFAHSPAYYRYRLALARLARLPTPMADYLHALFTNCPNHLFRDTTLRASRVGRGGLAIQVPLTRLKAHDIIALADESRAHNTVSSRHENLQKFFLDCDPATVACEVPVWTESWEFADYARTLGSDTALTGHIDVLRHESDGRIGVWDYKPRAAAERSAHVQVFLYALMLALRTGLPLTAFLCGYFDEHDAYIFRPSQTRFDPFVAILPSRRRGP